MSNITWIIRYDGYVGSPSFNNAVTLNDVLNVSMTRGRPTPIDPYIPSQVTINCRNIAAWTTTPTRGMVLYLCQTNSTNVVWMGIIRSVQINYGNKASMDTATIVVDSSLLFLSRKQFNSQVFAQADTCTYAKNIGTAANVYVNQFTYSGLVGKSISSAQTYTGNALDLFNLNVMTEGGYVTETQVLPASPQYFQFNILSNPRNFDQTADITVADSPSTNSEIAIESLNFWSSDQNYYNQVTVNPAGLASQTSGSGTYSLTMDTLDYTTSQALAHAQYLKSQFDTSTAFPKSFTAAFSGQSGNATRETAFRTLVNTFMGQLIIIKFRSTSYYAIIEGIEVAVDPSDTRVEVMVSAYDSNNYLVLNNAVLGRLNYNKLGF